MKHYNMKLNVKTVILNFVKYNIPKLTNLKEKLFLFIWINHLPSLFTLYFYDFSPPGTKVMFSDCIFFSFRSFCSVSSTACMRFLLLFFHSSYAKKWKEGRRKKEGETECSISHVFQWVSENCVFGEPSKTITGKAVSWPGKGGKRRKEEEDRR